MIFLLFFRNDYGQGCIPEILDLLKKTNYDNHPGYGLDVISMKAQDILKKKMPDTNVDIHFISGGTLTNLTLIRAILKPYEGVIACDTGHIATHETGSIEATGHKVITVPNAGGKITPTAIQQCFDDHMMSFEHMVYPKLVYISNSTEVGTVYTRDELVAIRKKCDELGLYLMMDGARLGVALMSGIDYTLNDLAKWCDLFYIGGTKNGALFGEAAVISNPAFKKHFRFIMKQSGAMLAKGWLLGVQFLGLFENDAFFTCAKHANKLAQSIQDKAHELGYPFFMKSDTNQIFLIVTREEYTYLSQYIDFEIWEKRDNMYVIRLVTSWATDPRDVELAYKYLKEAKK